jgi:hypothetical protein
VARRGSLRGGIQVHFGMVVRDVMLVKLLEERTAVGILGSRRAVNAGPERRLLDRVSFWDDGVVTLVVGKYIVSGVNVKRLLETRGGVGIRLHLVWGRRVR